MRILGELRSPQFADKSRQKSADGRSVMVAAVSDDLPHQNPCAQCGRLIAAPAWFENGPRRTAYLWQCVHCGYQFETVAFFREANDEPHAHAA
jgi:hypothetical protein